MTAVYSRDYRGVELDDCSVLSTSPLCSSSAPQSTPEITRALPLITDVFSHGDRGIEFHDMGALREHCGLLGGDYFRTARSALARDANRTEFFGELHGEG